MSIPQSGNTQAERFSAQLKLLRPDVTAKDRKDASEDLSVTTATISRYLNGNVLDNDTAASLIEYFKNKIATREKAVA